MKKLKMVCLLMVFCLAFSACGFNELNSALFASSSINTLYSDFNGMSIQYIDIGQGDSELIMLPDKKVLLIDGGDTGKGTNVIEALQKQSIEKIDFVVATHHHSDHIGGLTDVLTQYAVSEVYMPEIAQNDMPTTRAYEKFLDALNTNGCKIVKAKAGVTVFSCDEYKIDCLSPQKSDYQNLNSYSAVIKINYGKTAFIFMGDAQASDEKDIMKKLSNLKADVIKIGHHGSYTASSEEFLKAVNPEYAIISVGEGNRYGHPHDIILNRLKELGIITYRTDIYGTITITSDGENISITTEKQPES